jgi:hypothetical protein
VSTLLRAPTTSGRGGVALMSRCAALQTGCMSAPWPVCTDCNAWGPVAFSAHATTCSNDMEMICAAQQAQLHSRVGGDQERANYSGDCGCGNNVCHIKVAASCCQLLQCNKEGPSLRSTQPGTAASQVAGYAQIPWHLLGKQLLFEKICANVLSAW